MLRRQIHPPRLDQVARCSLLESGDGTLFALLHPEDGHLLAGPLDGLRAPLPPDARRHAEPGPRSQDAGNPATNRGGPGGVRRRQLADPDEQEAWGWQERVRWPREPDDRVLLSGATGSETWRRPASSMWSGSWGSTSTYEGARPSIVVL